MKFLIDDLISVRQRILDCPFCQKTRYTQDMVLEPRMFVVVPPDLYFSVGDMPISPPDRRGMSNINIIKRLSTGAITLWMQQLEEEQKQWLTRFFFLRTPPVLPSLAVYVKRRTNKNKQRSYT